MRICQECGVRIEDEDAVCPLCGASAGPASAQALSSDRDLASTPDPDEGHVRRVIWEVFSLVLATGAAVVFAADFAFSRSVTWSIIPLLAGGFLGLAGSAVILLGRRVQLILLSVTVSLLLTLALIDRATPGMPWFVPLALPVTAIAGLLVSSLLLVAGKVELPVFSVVALSLLSAGVLLLAVEAALSRFLTGVAFVSWSMLTFACILPPALLLFYLQHRLGTSFPEIRKRFHL